MMRRIERENTGLLHPGQDLVVAGYAGLAGTLKLVEAKKEELSHWFSDEYMDEIAECSQYLVSVTAAAAQSSDASVEQKQRSETKVRNRDNSGWDFLEKSWCHRVGTGGRRRHLNCHLESDRCL